MEAVAFYRLYLTADPTASDAAKVLRVLDVLRQTIADIPAGSGSAASAAH